MISLKKKAFSSPSRWDWNDLSCRALPETCCVGRLDLPGWAVSRRRFAEETEKKKKKKRMISTLPQNDRRFKLATTIPHKVWGIKCSSRTEMKAWRKPSRYDWPLLHHAHVTLGWSWFCSSSDLVSFPALSFLVFFSKKFFLLIVLVQFQVRRCERARRASWHWKHGQRA